MRRRWPLNPPEWWLAAVVQWCSRRRPALNAPCVPAGFLGVQSMPPPPPSLRALSPLPSGCDLSQSSRHPLPHSVEVPTVVRRGCSSRTVGNACRQWLERSGSSRQQPPALLVACGRGFTASRHVQAAAPAPPGSSKRARAAAAADAAATAVSLLPAAGWVVVGPVCPTLQPLSTRVAAPSVLPVAMRWHQYWLARLR